MLKQCDYIYSIQLIGISNWSHTKAQVSLQLLLLIEQTHASTNIVSLSKHTKTKTKVYMLFFFD
jgi:hypothetical protein